MSCNVLVRIWLPDRPGALGLVASTIGTAGGDILGIDVLENSKHVAVDEFAIVLPHESDTNKLVSSITSLEGVSVEQVREVKTFPDPRLDALELAAMICNVENASNLDKLLVNHLQTEFLCEWAALLCADGTTITSGADVPDTASLESLAGGLAQSPLVMQGEFGPDDLAIAVLEQSKTTLLLGRSGHPWRRRERAQLQKIAQIADRVQQILT